MASTFFLLNPLNLEARIVRGSLRKDRHNRLAFSDHILCEHVRWMSAPSNTTRQNHALTVPVGEAENLSKNAVTTLDN